MYLQFGQIIIIFILHLNSVSVVQAAIHEECEGIETGAVVASHISCAKYIFCDGDESFEGECLDDNYFNAAAGNCDDRAVVVCRIEQGIGNNVLPIVSNRPSNQPNTLDGAGNGAQSSNQNQPQQHNNNNFNQQQQQQNSNNNLNQNQQQQTNNNNFNQNQVTSQANGNTISNTQTLSPIIQPANAGFNVDGTTIAAIAPPAIVDPPPNYATQNTQPPQCPFVYAGGGIIMGGLQNLIHLPNPDSCSAYYTCYNGVAIPMICERHMYFNAQSGKCERQENVNCTYNRPVRLHCSKGVYDFIPHPRNCEYYYFCSNGFLMIFQCPFEFTWHFERRTCVHRSQAKCFSESIYRDMFYV